MSSSGKDPRAIPAPEEKYNGATVGGSRDSSCATARPRTTSLVPEFSREKLSTNHILYQVILCHV